MKLEVGMYVRYTRGMINGYVPLRIGRIVDCLTDDLIKINNSQVILRSDIVKASHNIIDLIEEGDYVNGKLVYYDEELKCLGQSFVDGDGNFYFESITKDWKNKIKTVLTKEQYENNCYKVDDKQEDI